jgi:two-component system, cell cycle sensor histidine kinase and response regulator CckA
MTKKTLQTSPAINPTREKFLGQILTSTRKSYYPQLKDQLEAAQSNERRLQLLIDSLPARISYVNTDSRYLFINKAYETILGRPRAEMIGKTIAEVIGAENYRRAENYIKTAIGGQEVRFEFEFQLPDSGSTWLDVHYVPEMDHQGRVLGFYTLTRDLTERRKREEDLRQQRDLLDTLFDNILLGITLWSPDGRLLRINRGLTDLTGYTRADIPDLPTWFARAYPDPVYRARVQAIWQGDTDHPQAMREFKITCRDGSTKFIEFRASFLEDGRALVTLDDISDRKAAEAEKEAYAKKLLQAQKMEAIGTLAGGLAHDFNNLLMGIQGRVSLMLLDLPADHSYQEHLASIEAHVKSAAALAQQLLGYARGGKYDVKVIQLNEVIEKSATMFGRTKKEVQIHYDLSPDLPAIEADPNQIEQVLLNLFVNAWQAMPEEGEIHLKTDVVEAVEGGDKNYRPHSDAYVKVSVSDTGFGMDEETLAKIFDPFFTTKEKSRGTGLGLASVYGIVKNHGGSILVTSEVGQGSTFDLYFPISEKSVHPQNPVENAIVKGNETLLLVDDEEMIREVGSSMLERLGYHVLTAGSGGQAIQLMSEQKEQIVLVILDLIMPGMDGSQTYDRLKTIKPGLKVILSSGYARNGKAETVMQKGCDGFIQKPFDLASLSIKVRSILDAAP